MESVVQLLKDRNLLVNQLMSYTFEYLHQPSTELFEKIKEILNSSDQTCRLILIKVDSSTTLYIKESELNCGQIHVYKMNSSLADLELAGVIKNSSIHMLDNRQFLFA